MANLLETIQQNSAAMQQPQGVTDQTQAVGTLLRAKTGKATAGDAVGPSNLAEQQAVTQNNQQMQNTIAPQAAIQQTGLQAQQAGQQQQFTQAKAETAQANKFDNIQTKLKTDSIFQNLEQSKGKIDQQTYNANLEQLGTNLRLQNQQYIDQLQLQGQKARLDDSLSFKEEMTRTTFDDNTSVLQKTLGDKSILDANDNEFHQAIANMGIDDAYQTLRAQMLSSDNTTLYQAEGNAATSAIGAYGKYSDSQAQSNPNAGTTSGSTK